jgi:pSer/pThr/pTyr-binding forkhead associated (FHA) protein
MPLFHKNPSDSPVGLEVIIETAHPDPDVPSVAVTALRFPFRIGRLAKPSGGHRLAPDALYLDDPRPHNVSRDHCALELKKGTLWVRDCGSTLGTEVNGQPIGKRFPSMFAELAEGENTLILGSSHSPHQFRVTVVRTG